MPELIDGETLKRVFVFLSTRGFCFNVRGRAEKLK